MKVVDAVPNIEFDLHALSRALKIVVKHSLWQKAALSCCVGFRWYPHIPYPMCVLYPGISYCFVRFFSSLSVFKFSESICISWTCSQHVENSNCCRLPSRNKMCILSVTLICVGSGATFWGRRVCVCSFCFYR